MNCRKCEAHLSEFIDKELDPGTAREVSRHLATCDKCRAREAGFMRLIPVLGSLPRISMSEAEQFRLMEGLRQGIKQTGAAELHAHARLFPRIATAAAILVTGVVVTVALMTTPTSRNTSTPEEFPAVATSSEEQDTTGSLKTTITNLDATGNQATKASTALASIGQGALSFLPTPQLVKSSNDYSKSQVAEYSKDLGTRLDFYSDIWYQPASASSKILSGSSQSSIQAYCLDNLRNLAAAAGENPDSLQKSLSIVSTQFPPGKFAIPCFVERASYLGQPVWIISYSVPEDGQLFTNPEVAALVNLAKQLYASGNLQDSSLMEALTSTFAPGSTYYSVSNSTRGSGDDGVLDLQALISSLAENNNLVSYLRQLAQMDTEKLLSLLSHETGYPIQISTSLLDMLTQRVWVVNPDSGQILFHPAR